MSSPGSMRDRMPQVARFIDELRAAFGETPATARQLNDFMKQGVAGHPDCFYAQENGETVGTPFRKRWLAPPIYVPKLGKNR